MKKTAITLHFLMSFFTVCISQSDIKKVIVTDHRQNAFLRTYQVFKIDALKKAVNDGRFEKAKKQEGVIGNDFFGDKKIGFAKGKNNWYDVTDYQPVDGYKRSFCGKLKEYYCMNPSSSTFDLDVPVVGTTVYSKDIDDDFIVVINVDEDNELLQKYRTKIRSLLDIDEGFPWPQPIWNKIEGEIDIHQSHKKNYLPHSGKVPSINQSTVCLFGAWVIEVAGDFNPTGHGDHHEIHPAEQIWWKEDHNEYSLYNLILAADNSGKFNEPEDFYALELNANGFENTLVEPWGKSPLNGVFAIPFEVDLRKKQKAVFSITGTSAKNVKNSTDDTRTHFLVHGRDTLAFVKENNFDELVNIDFYNVGYAPSASIRNDKNNSLVRGFLIIKSRVGIPNRAVPTNQSIGAVADFFYYAGNLKLEVKQWLTSANIKQNVVVNFVSIKRLHDNSYRGVNPNTNDIMTLFSPNPVPNDFNEKSVIVGLRKGGQSQGVEIPISGLLKLQTHSLGNTFFSWQGFITDTYGFYVNCKTKYRDGFYDLGELALTGLPTRQRKASEKTVLHYQYYTNYKRNETDRQNDSTRETIDVNLFEINFTLEHY